MFRFLFYICIFRVFSYYTIYGKKVLQARGLFNPFVGGGKHASHLKKVVPVAAGSTLPTSEL
jgi:hypothetical protein